MDILDHVAIRVRCGVCSSEYSVPASVVLEGQLATASGCPGCSDYECEARFVATLADFAGAGGPAEGLGGVRGERDFTRRYCRDAGCRASRFPPHAR